MHPSINTAQSGFPTTYHWAEEQTVSFKHTSHESSEQQYSSRREQASYHLELNSQAAESLVYSKQSYSFSTSSPIEVRDKPAGDLLSAASTILDFVEQHLAQEQAAGATQDELANIVAQGLAGFEQGFGEAKQILGDLGQLSDVVENTISQLYQQVTNGLAELSKTYIDEVSTDNDMLDLELDDQANSAPSNPLPGLISPSDPQQLNLQEQLKQLGGGRDQLANLLDALSIHAQDIEETTAFSNTIEYGRKDRFSFELTTADGDKVKINASNMTAFYGEYRSENTHAGEGLSEKNTFHLSVEGELNESEQRAINDLLGQVMSLADEFYNGDINLAYEAALQLNYDQREIVSYALSLRQVEQYTVTTNYTQFDPRHVDLPVNHQPLFSVIGDFAQSLLEALNSSTSNQPLDYQSLFAQLAEQIDEQMTEKPRHGFGRLVNDLIEKQQ